MGKCRRNYVEIINDYQLPPTRKIDINDQQWYVLIKCFMPLGFLSSVVGIFFGCTSCGVHKKINYVPINYIDKNSVYISGLIN